MAFVRPSRPSQRCTMYLQGTSLCASGSRPSGDLLAIFGGSMGPVGCPYDNSHGEEERLHLLVAYFYFLSSSLPHQSLSLVTTPLLSDCPLPHRQPLPCMPHLPLLCYRFRVTVPTLRPAACAQVTTPWPRPPHSPKAQLLGNRAASSLPLGKLCRQRDCTPPY